MPRLTGMSSFFSQSLQIAESAWAEVTERVTELLPQAVVALFIFLCGLLIASLVRFLLLKFLALFAVDKLVAKTQLSRMLKEMGIHSSASEILGSLLFWLITLFALILASEALELTQVAHALTVLTRYVPKIIAAFLIIVFGMLLAKFLQTFVTQAIGRTQRGYERLAGRIVNGVVLVFVLIAALEQLEVELSLVTTNFMILLGVVLAVIGLALALGARPLLENIIACQQLQSTLRVGDRVSVDNVHGSVKGYTIASVVIDTGEHEVHIPARVFLESVFRRSSP